MSNILTTPAGDTPTVAQDCRDAETWRNALEDARSGREVLAILHPAVWSLVKGDLAVTITPRPVEARPDNPLVAQAVQVARTVDGRRLPIRQPGVLAGAEQEIAHIGSASVAGWVPCGRGGLTLVAGVPTPSAEARAWLNDLTGTSHSELDVEAITVPNVSASGWTAAPPDGITSVNDPLLLRAAAHAGQSVPAPLYRAIVDFADLGNSSGALLVRDVPLGVIPPTPLHPGKADKESYQSEFSLLTIARLLGQPVGYAPEHGGDLVQNISPTPSGAYRQVSTSSAVVLEFHTEAAFHPMMPRYLALLCLRGDPQATTTLTPVSAMLPKLTAEHVELLRQPLFTTGVDESYTSVRSQARSLPRPILTGTSDHPRVWLDNDLMQGVTTEAQAALEAVAQVARENSLGVTLQTGDLLIVDNTTAVHGRSPFTPRYDGTDRWLQRTLIVADPRDAGEDLEGRIIATTFMT